MTEEENTLFDSYKDEVDKCWLIAQQLDELNPEIKGAFTGTPSERIIHQLEYLRKRISELEAEVQEYVDAQHPI